jgi:hypothetical protein
MLLINKTLSEIPHLQTLRKERPMRAQTIEIRGFRLTLPFPLAYDGSRKDQQVWSFSPGLCDF